METLKKHVRTFIADGRSNLDKMADDVRTDEFFRTLRAAEVTGRYVDSVRTRIVADGREPQAGFSDETTEFIARIMKEEGQKRAEVQRKRQEVLLKKLVSGVEGLKAAIIRSESKRRKRVDQLVKRISASPSSGRKR